MDGDIHLGRPATGAKNQRNCKIATFTVTSSCYSKRRIHHRLLTSYLISTRKGSALAQETQQKSLSSEAEMWGCQLQVSGYNVLSLEGFEGEIDRLLFVGNDFISTDLASSFPLLVFSPILSSSSWPSEQPDGADAHRRTMFYLRLLRHYGLLTLITGCRRPGSSDPADPARAFNRQQLSRIVLADQEAKRHLRVAVDGSGVQHGLSRLKDDAALLCKCLRSLITPAHSNVLATDKDMIRALACVHLVGRLPRQDVISYAENLFKPDHLVSKLIRDTSFRPQDNLNYLVGPSVQNDVAPSPDEADLSAQAWNSHAQLRTYHLLRDFDRWLRSGAMAWAYRAAYREPERKWRILIIDPQLASAQAASPGRTLADRLEDPQRPGMRLRKRLDIIFGILFRGGRVEVNVIDDSRGILPHATDAVGDSVVALDRFFATALRERVKLVTNSPPKSLDLRKILDAADHKWDLDELPSDAWSLWQYDAIFCEVEYEQAFAGPQIIQKLGSFFERTTNPKKEAVIREKHSAGRAFNPMELPETERISLEAAPVLIVLTRSSNFGYTHQCLNLGAHYYVAKDRLFQIPTRLVGAIKDEEHRTLHRSNRYIASLERTGHRSNFRTLYSLRPDRRAALHREGAADLVTGNETDRRFLQRLPKADLHCHLGTTISIDTIEALALNTVGRMVCDYSTEANEPDGPNHRSRHVGDAISRALEAVVMTNALWATGRQALLPGLHPAQLLYAVTRWIIGHRNRESRGGKPPPELVELLLDSENPLEHVVAELAPISSPIKHHEAAALIVVATWLLQQDITQPDFEGEIVARWQYFADVSNWKELLKKKLDSPGEGDEADLWIRDFIEPAAKTCHDQTLKTGGAAELYPASAYFGLLHDNITERSHKAIKLLSSKIESAKILVEGYFKGWTGLTEKVGKDAKTAVRSGRQSLSLRELVSARRPGGDDVQPPSLLRYLWGCGLLGSDHLQYPENLLLAAYDIVRQHAQECIIYAEVRCETPGFKRAGMTGIGATETLRAGFDLASGFIHATGGTREKSITNARRKPFVRVNLLLAAKRHKTASDCSAVISLLETYLARSPRKLVFSDTTVIPAWWKPCDVVGFDLSGNEAVTDPAVEAEVKRLFQYNSPITIHAGEAATADRVWQAVYGLHARRIGHGLRLRENPRLMQYCIDEGICMEMCPISNLLTHGFNDVLQTQEYQGSKVEHYPLRYYMAAGLEVCINTDNRSLHDGNTLTDEYMKAAKLSGGFSRWEVLKLARAGFKHAFLPKVDIAGLLSAVENRVYSMTAHQEGVDWWPHSDT